nr:hypothetical protein GCM10020185_30400 [Pseudomonas brassicacearum subsp. brassicacearum]
MISPRKTLLVTTGSEAVENAVKIARAATGRAGVIAFTGAYHGRTMMTLGLTGKVVPYSAGMGLMPGGIFRALYPNELHGVSIDDSIASIERIFKNDAEPRDIAAIIIEPVQGEGGFYVAPKEFMKRLRALCDQHGILLIADEVQTGAGRTGTFFAMEQMGVAADLTTFAKSIAGGFPLAGVCGKAEYMDAIAPGGLGGTYAGSPIACAAALAVMDVFEEEHLLDRCKAVGERLVTGLKAIQKKYPVIGDVRALGAMIAVELFEKRRLPQAERGSGSPNRGQGARQGPDPAVLRHLRQRTAGAGAADRAGRATGQRPGDPRRVLLRTLSDGCALIHKKTRLLAGFFHVREPARWILSCLERPPRSKVQVWQGSMLHDCCGFTRCTACVDRRGRSGVP